MLSEKKFENITVNEIAERANVRRATFYKHFADKYDFLAYYVHSIRVNFDSSGHSVKPDATAKYYIDYARALIDRFDGNEAIVKNILESELFGTILTIAVTENLKDTREKLTASVRKGMQLPASIDMIADMLIGGLATAILYWFKDGKPKPKEEFLSEISLVLNKLQS